jgi:uncharacterized protein (TIGR01244 family)
MRRVVAGEGVEVADQPTEAELADLKREGFRGVVNLRHDGEPDQPLSPAAEGLVVEGLGLDYAHIPVGGAPLSREAVEAFGQFLDRHSGEPVLVHCKMGGRAAALVVARLALREGWSAETALREAEARGLTLPPPLRILVANFLSENGPA